MFKVFSKHWFSASATLVTTIGIAVLAFASLPYDSILALAERLAPDGKMGRFTPEFFAVFAGRLRLGGGVLAIAGLGSLAFRRSFSAYLNACIADTAFEIRRVGTRCRALAVETPRRDLWLLAAIVTFGAALRAYVLVTEPMRADESASFIYFVNRPWIVTLLWFDGANDHLLNSILAHASCMLFGSEPWAIRLPVYIAGVSLMPLTWVVGRRLFASSGVGLAAASLVAICTPLIDYSANARGYSLLAFFSMLSVLIAMDVLEHRRRGATILYGMTAALAFLSLATMLYTFLLTIAWMAISSLRSRERAAGLRHTAACFAITVVFVVATYVGPVLAVGVGRIASNEHTRSRGPAYVAEHIGPMLADTAALSFADWPLALAIAVLAGVLAHLLTARRPRCTDPNWVSIAPILVVGIPALLFLHGVVPPARIWTPVLPFAFLIAAAGWQEVLALKWMPRVADGVRIFAMASIVAVVGSVALSQVSYIRSTPRDTFRGAIAMAEHLKRHVALGDAIVGLSPADNPLIYYSLRAGIPRRAFKTDRDDIERLWVFALDREKSDFAGGYAIDRVFEEKNVARSAAAQTETVARFGDGLLYLVVEPKPAPASLHQASQHRESEVENTTAREEEQ